MKLFRDFQESHCLAKDLESSLCNAWFDWFASWGHHMFSTGMDFTTKTVFMIGTLAAVPRIRNACL